MKPMSERGENITHVNTRLGVKSIEWQMEKRILKRIGYVMRMDNGRLTKIIN